MFYNLILKVIMIFLSIIGLFNKQKKEFINKRLKQNIKIEYKKYCWIHCSSVGEVNLSESLIKEFLEKTEISILLSVVTDTGYKTALNKYNQNIRIKLIFFPLDNYSIIKKIINQIDLKKLILIETEIWPNLIKLCSQKAEVYIVNGRISDKSYNNYFRLKNILKKLFKNIDGFIMQTEEDRKKIINLGADPNKTYNFGNLKFDIKLPNYSKEELERLKENHGTNGKKIFVAGSTRDGEEEYILEVFDKLENYFLYLVPRHIERCKDIEERLLKNNYNYSKWNQVEINDTKKENNNIMLVDKIGVLRMLYAGCDIAFVGGTIVNIGGHSLLEPLYYKKTPIFGNYIQNVKEISKEILKRKIGFQVNDSEEFLQAIKIIEEKGVDQIEIDKFFHENSMVAENTFNKIIEKD